MIAGVFFKFVVDIFKASIPHNFLKHFYFCLPSSLMQSRQPSDLVLMKGLLKSASINGSGLNLLGILTFFIY